MNKIIGNPTTTPMAVPDWNQKNPLKADYIKNKPDLSQVATSGSYNDLSDKLVEDLGEFWYVYESGNEEQGSELGKYETWYEAVDETRKTGIYKICNKEIYDGKLEINEESLLFVVSGLDQEHFKEYVTQMIFNNLSMDVNGKYVTMPQLRRYWWNGEKYSWSGWTSAYGDTGSDGFETSANKNNGEITEGDDWSYPTSSAVYNFVTKNTEHLVDDINELWEGKVDQGQVVYSVESIDDEYSEIPSVYVTEQLINPQPIKAVPTTLTPNKQYNFGTIESLSLAFPILAMDGAVIYLTFKSGATPTALTIDTTNTCDIECIPEVNTGYEIFGKFVRTDDEDGFWIVNYSEYTVSEV